MDPLISVIIPCYNQGQYLNEALESVYNQTYKNIEIIVVDDGSTEEETINILNELKNKNLTIYHKNNGHLSSARNYGIARSKSDYYVALDADDKLHPLFVELTLSHIVKEPGIAVVSSWAKHFGAKSDIKVLDGGSIENFLRFNNCTACALVRKNVWEEVGGYDEKMKEGFEDWEFYINITKRGYKIKVLPQPLFYYRIKKASMIIDTLKKRPEIYHYIILKHKDVYDRYYPQIIYELEKDLQRVSETFLSSTNYRVGKGLLYIPRQIFSFIKSFYKWLRRLQKNG